MATNVAAAKVKAACSGQHGMIPSTTRDAIPEIESWPPRCTTRRSNRAHGTAKWSAGTSIRTRTPDSESHCSKSRLTTYPLSAAWDAGAWKWDPQQRQVFANDVTELIAVPGSPNRQKSDKRLDEWLPSYQPCAYIQRYLAVAVKYQLPVTLAEHKTATSTCPATPPAVA
jgi:Protein of unknown function (DUF1524)